MPIDTILVPTVGGSCSPILDSIRYHNPDFVCFICSGDNDHREGTYTVVHGEGSPCWKPVQNNQKEYRPNIVTQSRLGTDQYRIDMVDDPDDFDDCYRVIDQSLADLSLKYPRARILADYTGGTKSLSAALVLAALNRNVDLVLIRGKRHDLVKVTEGMTYAHRVSVASVAADNQFRLTHALERERDYAAAVRTIESTTAQQALPRGQEELLLDHLQIARAFDAWDKFDHVYAYELFEALSKKVRTALRKSGYYDALLSVIHSRALTDDAFREQAEDLLKRPVKGTHGFEVVEDLLLNASRRAQQGRFDDAIARLYRSVELAGQILLRKDHDIRTNEVDPNQIPATFRTQWLGDDVRPVKVGLRRAADLLAALDPTGYGALWDEWKGRVLDALDVRNQSILAHGFRPVSDQGFYKVNEALGGYAFALIELARTSNPKASADPVVIQLPNRFVDFLETS